MQGPVRCQQRNCDDDATFKFTWPGRDQAAVCATCALTVRGVANAMGLHVQFLVIDGEEHFAGKLAGEATTPAPGKEP